MKSTFEFNHNATESLINLKKPLNVGTKKDVIQRALVLTEYLLGEADEKGIVTIIQKDGGKIKLVLGG
jgi:hypothetical protein